MIKILQGFVTDQNGGISKYIYNNYKYLDKRKIQYDFLYLNHKPSYYEECEQLGANFYYIPCKTNIFKYVNLLYRYIKQGNYDAIYFNMAIADIIPIIIASLAGAQKIILHAHSTDIDTKNCIKRILVRIYNYISKILLKFFNIFMFCACSEEAGRFIFGDKIVTQTRFRILHNAINVESFSFNVQIRREVRHDLGLHDKNFVVGHVGRFSYSKNHDFLIDIFSEILKVNAYAVLILVGIGENEPNIRDKVNRLKINKSVIFLGARDDVNNIMQAFDCFILPSNFEGLGIVGIEAQASGLRSFFSDRVPADVGITKLSEFIPLKCSSKEWALRILSTNNVYRKKTDLQIINAGYEIKEEIKKIEKIYFKLKEGEEE